MKVSLVIPYIADSDERLKIVQRCVEVANQNKTLGYTELVLLNNGPRTAWEAEVPIHIHNYENIGVLPSFVQGFDSSTGDIVAFIHSDVLLHEVGWDERIERSFEDNPNLGLLGLFGAKGLTPDGHRHECMSFMAGYEWGKCGCHPIAAQHHGNLMTGLAPAAMLDGVGMFFRAETLETLICATDSFANWRAPHHFYDRILGCKTVQAQWDVGVLGLAFDHWSGATAGGSEVYEKSARKWLAKNGHELEEGQVPDQAIYNIAEKQFFDEWRDQLPLFVNENWEYKWGN